MSSNFRRYPHAVHGLVGLGGARLSDLAAKTSVSLRGLPNAPGAIAGALRDKLASPAMLREHLTGKDFDLLGERLNIGKRSAWTNQKTSFDDAVFAKLFEEAQPAAVPEVKTHQSTRDPSGAANWPELWGIERWVCHDDRQQKVVTKALAKALGMKPLEPAGMHRFPRFEDAQTGLVWLAVAGDSFEMGLTDTEKRALTRMTKGWSEEAKMHASDLVSIARPEHEVDVPAFLCTETPVTVTQAAKLTQGTSTTGEVCLFEPSAAVTFAARTNARLLTEAEWEYVARSGGARSWVSVKADPRKHDPQEFVREELAVGLGGANGFLFGIRGFGWGSWVEDSWHPTYQGAPVDGSAWDPREMPEVVRGGAFLSWPWQIDGEALLLHAAHRERKQKGSFPLLLARDLPLKR